MNQMTSLWTRDLKFESWRSEAEHEAPHSPESLRVSEKKN